MPPKVYRFGHTYDVVVGVGCAGLRATFGIGAEMKATGFVASALARSGQTMTRWRMQPMSCAPSPRQKQEGHDMKIRAAVLDRMGVPPASLRFLR